MDEIGSSNPGQTVEIDYMELDHIDDPKVFSLRTGHFSPQSGTDHHPLFPW
jgi:hypothetical protein